MFVSGVVGLPSAQRHVNFTQFSSRPQSTLRSATVIHTRYILLNLCFFHQQIHPSGPASKFSPHLPSVKPVLTVSQAQSVERKTLNLKVAGSVSLHNFLSSTPVSNRPQTPALGLEMLFFFAVFYALTHSLTHTPH
jgi:hypothetical protein